LVFLQLLDYLKILGSLGMKIEGGIFFKEEFIAHAFEEY
jgi:hypothetical protein